MLIADQMCPAAPMPHFQDSPAAHPHALAAAAGVDTTSNPMYCGSCDVSCPAGQSCRDSACSAWRPQTSLPLPGWSLLATCMTRCTGTQPVCSRHGILP